MRYAVIFSPYTDRHYIRTFNKKYGKAWEKTHRALMIEFAFVDALFEKRIAETIHVSPDGNVKICKTEFKILGTNVSRHASGNRVIIAVDNSTGVVHVLLIYSKTDLSGKRSETAKWQKLVKDNYPEYKNLF